MKSNKCPVRETYNRCIDILESCKDQREYQLVNEIRELIFRFTKGIGDENTFSFLLHKVQNAILFSENLKELLSPLYSYISRYKEVFEDHVLSKNCVFEECPLLIAAPCQRACPADIDIPTFISLIGQKRYKEAIEVIRKDNPFPWICGIVCTHPCEINCVRGKIDSPISIMDLKGFVAEASLSLGEYKNPKKLPENGKKVAVIGGGPAGLSCAYYLSLLGYKVCIIEALPVLGGMMRVGIPAYRLPREIIDKEIDMILSLGVEVRLNTKFGKDVDFSSLREEGFDAYLITIGAHECHKLGIEGEDDFSEVIPAVSFLRDINLGKKIYPGDRVVIVGGGNVAIDAARTCVRLGCKEVVVAYRRSRAEMPAHPEEVMEAEEEGVRFEFLTIPKKVMGRERVLGLSCVKAILSEPDSSGRRRPVPVEGSDFVIDADAIIPAIGQRVDNECINTLKCEMWISKEGGVSGIQWTRRKTIDIIDKVNMRTNLKGVFAAGDVVSGPATVVEAIGSGKRAAYGIHRYLSGESMRNIDEFPKRRGREPFFIISATDKETLDRPVKPHLPILRRKTTFQQVHLGIAENSALSEAKRCLRCDVCIRCGRCVEVCKFEVGVNALHLGYISGEGETKISLTQHICVGCGACANNCPTGAMRIQDIGEERVLSMCGTILSRNKLVFCKECGKVISTKRHIDLLRTKMKDMPLGEDFGKLCDSCSRMKRARFNS